MYFVTQKAVSEAVAAAINDDYEYFNRLYLAQTTKAMLVLVALGGGPRVKEWVQRKPIAEIMLANKNRTICLHRCVHQLFRVI